MTMYRDAANSKGCARMLIRISRWGVPDVITSDRGAQFVSDLWREICQLMGRTTNRTNAPLPQAFPAVSSSRQVKLDG